MTEQPTDATLPAGHKFMDAAALNRWREISGAGDGHDMMPINKNSVRRLIATIDCLAMQAAAPTPNGEGVDINGLAVRITEHAITELDADEENTPQIEAFGNAVEKEIAAALEAVRAGDGR